MEGKWRLFSKLLALIMRLRTEPSFPYPIVKRGNEVRPFFDVDRVVIISCFVLGHSRQQLLGQRVSRKVVGQLVPNLGVLSTVICSVSCGA